MSRISYLPQTRVIFALPIWVENLKSNFLFRERVPNVKILKKTTYSFAKGVQKSSSYKPNYYFAKTCSTTSFSWTVVKTHLLPRGIHHSLSTTWYIFYAYVHASTTFIYGRRFSWQQESKFMLSTSNPPLMYGSAWYCCSQKSHSTSTFYTTQVGP